VYCFLLSGIDPAAVEEEVQRQVAEALQHSQAKVERVQAELEGARKNAEEWEGTRPHPCYLLCVFKH
jgi:uncharacterized protein YcaQ